MRTRLLIAGAMVMLASAPAAAVGAVTQERDSGHREVFATRDLNICGDPATFTFEVTWHLHAVENDSSFRFAYSETFKYSVVFDDPALESWRGHGSETIRYRENRAGTVFRETLNSKEGPVQIIIHNRLRTDPDGDVIVDRAVERVTGC